MAVVNRNTSIEFIVKPKQDLYLEGSLRRLPRVSKGEAYTCQMQKNQTFSCLFRHYAKHNGLCKEDLVFSFVDELLPDQSPETVHLMPQDEIWVEHRVRKENAEASEQPPVLTPYAEQFRSIFESGRHADVKFIVGEEEVEIPAHRAILSARAEYFSAMFREDGMLESTNGVVRTHHDPNVFRRMLEFIYTNSVRDLATAPPNDVIALITLANEYLLDDLRVLCERAATRIITLDNITRLMLLSANHTGSGLREACLEFMRTHKKELLEDPSFRQEVEQSPELGLFLFESTFPNKRSIGMDGDDSPDCSSSGKRRRVAENSETETDVAVPAHLAAAGAHAQAHAHAGAHGAAPQGPLSAAALTALAAGVPANAAAAAQVLPVPPHIPPAQNAPQPPL